MEKYYELLEKLESLEIIQKSIDWAENIPDEIWKDYFENNYKMLKSDLEVDKHRWYETSISVIEIYDNLLGIKHISNLYSESSSCEDCDVVIEFFTMKEVVDVTYKRLS